MHGWKLVRRAGAALVAAALAAGGLGAAAVPAAADAPLAGTEVLALGFDGALTDAGPHDTPVSVRRGAERYTTGVAGQAFEFDGSTALDLGTGAHLQPQRSEEPTS